MLSFKDFIVVDYKPGEHELIKYAAHKRRRGRIGEEAVEEKKKGLWHNIHQKRKRGERPAKPGEKGYPKTLDIESTEEALDFSQRRARARAMKKNKNKIAMGRRRAAKKPADSERLMKRAQRQARMMLFKKLAKDTPKSDVPASRKQGIEKRLDKMKPKIAKIARKLLPQVRKTEKSRRQGK